MLSSYLFDAATKQEEPNFIDLLKNNKNISGSLENIVNEITNILSVKIHEKKFNDSYYRGVKNTLTFFLYVFENVDKSSITDVNNAIDNFLFNMGVHPVITDVNDENYNSSFLKTVNVINDPDADFEFRVTSPGYYLKVDENSKNNILIKYAEVEYNSPKYTEGCDILNKGGNVTEEIYCWKERKINDNEVEYSLK